MRSIAGCSGLTLTSLWAIIGWRHRGVTMGPIGVAQGHFEVILEPLWNTSLLLWRNTGNFMGQCGITLEHFTCEPFLETWEPFWGTLEPFWGKSGVSFGLYWCNIVITGVRL